MPKPLEDGERKMKINTEVTESVHKLLKATASVSGRTAYEQAAIYIAEGIARDPKAQEVARIMGMSAPPES